MFLAVFDFDHTIIDANSDTHIHKLFSTDDDRIQLEKLRPKYPCWTDFMQETFHRLYQRNIRQCDYIKNMQEIPLTNGFLNLIQYLHSLENSHLIIASDSNLFFINTILKYHKIDNAFKDIFTNPAYFNDEQCLIIKQYGQETCSTCPSNMCKREIIQRYVEKHFSEGIPILYIGDGHNDVCAANNLKRGDLVCARTGYRMAKELKEQNLFGKQKLNANLFEWNHGKDIEEFIKTNWLNQI